MQLTADVKMVTVIDFAVLILHALLQVWPEASFWASLSVFYQVAVCPPYGPLEDSSCTRNKGITV